MPRVGNALTVAWVTTLVLATMPSLAGLASGTTTYTVGFYETGLSGQTWGVTIGSVTQSTNGQGGWIVFQEPNGTYSYQIVAPTGYTAAPSSGKVTVSGSNPPYVAVTFTPSQRYSVGFMQTGLSGLNWSVTLTLAGTAPSTLTSNAAWIVFQEPNGSYTYRVYGPAGYQASPMAGSGTVAGKSPPYVAVSFSSYATLPTPVQHVVVVELENSDLHTILSYSPYMDYLWNTYGQVTRYYPACHGSLPDYTSIESGRYYVCGGPISQSSAMDLPDVLEAKTQNWGGYFESMPTPCDRNWSGQMYDPSHNPFLISHDIVGNASRCNAHVLNSAAFNQSVAAGTLPSFSMYVPNMRDDCEDTNLTFCTSWLKGFLAPMLNSTVPAVHSLMQHTAFFIAFDEGLNYLGYSVGGIVNSYCQNHTGLALTVCGGHTYLSVVSPYSYGMLYSTNASSYSLESTVEYLLGLGSDGGYDGTSNFPAMAALFT
jgi:phosphoesterase family protein